jgi:hypothetical protein
MRGILVALALVIAGCDSQRPDDQLKGDATKPALVLTATPLELGAKASLEKRQRDQQAAEALEKRVKNAMEIVLIDPFSAQFRALRSGRNGAVCGQVNGKNRMGAYVGFKDFVVGRDGTTVWISRNADGVETELYSSFAEAYVNACATKSQAARYKAATEVPAYSPDYEYNDAADAAAAAADAAKKM